MDDDDLVSRSDALDERLSGAVGVERNVRDLMVLSQRNRRVIRWLIVSVVLDVLLTVVTASLGYVAIEAAIQSNGVRQEVHTTCVSGNQARAVNLQLWTYILDLPPTTPRTEAQQQQVDQFRAYIRKTFTPRKC